MNYYCKYCGHSAQNLPTLVNNYCQRHPSGPNKGKHALYEGSEKSRYECKHCGTGAANLLTLTGNVCKNHPSGPNKGPHEPAL